MKRWVAADPHFYHDAIAVYCSRPANHTQLIVENMARVIKREDVLYILGDVHFGTEQQLKTILASIPGRKYLVRGNHDRWTDTKYLLCGFSGVFDSVTVGNVYMTHIPSEPPPGMVNLHGHLHNLGYKGEPSFGEGYGQFCNDKHILYAPELYNYQPVQLSSIVAKGKRGDKYALQELHLPRRKRNHDRAMPSWVPPTINIGGRSLFVPSYSEGGCTTARVDGNTIYNAITRRYEGELPENHEQLCNQP